MSIYSGIANNGSIPVLEKAISFAEQRHKVIAHNIANIDTPFFKEKDLDAGAFREMLIDAIEQRKATGRPFEMSSSSYVGQRADGSIWVTPIETGNGNGLRHDESTISVDKLMAKLSKNTLKYNGLVGMLAKQYKLIKSAIRGRMA